MYYIYVLFNEKADSEKKFYLGYTNDLRRRVAEHNQGMSQWTKRFGPWRLIYYEAYASMEDAMDRERKLKSHGKGIQELKKRLRKSIHKAKKVRD